MTENLWPDGVGVLMRALKTLGVECCKIKTQWLAHLQKISF